MLHDNILLNVIELEILFRVRQGYPRVLNAVVLVPVKVRLIVVPPVIEKKIMEKRAPRRRAVIELQVLAAR